MCRLPAQTFSTQLVQKLELIENIEPTLWFELDQQLHHDELGAANLPSS
jgi:hypothetical protein